jgi:Protein of unknown function (DUF3606)
LWIGNWLERLKGYAVPLTLQPLKGDRSHVDLSNEAVARHWSKRFGSSKEEIEAAIAKVGNNPETVAKELGSRRANLP